MQSSAITTLGPEAKRTFSTELSATGTRTNKQHKFGKDGEKQKEANLHHTKETEGNLRPKGLD